MSIGGLLSLAAGGFYSVRYARNQIVANNLLQESLEYVRNTRDTSVIGGLSFQNWQDTLKVDVNGNQTGGVNSGCFNQYGCIVDPYSISPAIKQCSGTCPSILYYPDNEFYGYSASYPFSSVSSPYQTSFNRTIKVSESATNPDQVIVTGTITWLNGSVTKSLTQSVLLTNWTP